MDKRLGVNLGLLGIILVLVLFVVYSDEEVVEESIPISNIDPESINQIEVQRRDLKDFIFIKEGENWFMQSPLSVKANPARINTMLRLLNSQSHAQLNASELQRYALDEPSIVLKLNDQHFAFGSTDAIDQRRYVLYDNTVHLTDDFLFQQLNTNAAFFADTTLLPEGFDIKAIEFPDNKLELLGGRWQLQELADINPETFEKTVFNWNNAMAISASKYSEPAQKETITLIDKNNERIEFVVVATEPHLILGREDLGIQYHMCSDEAEKLILKENESAADIPAD